LELKREEQRRKRAEERKKEALLMYLQSTRDKKRAAGKDVDVLSFSMPTPDGGAELLTDARLQLVPGMYSLCAFFNE
jgi:hypothetical protein